MKPGTKEARNNMYNCFYIIQYEIAAAVFDASVQV